ncbi:MAG: hypothetical protein ACFCVD_09510 [Nodosilinea sp.]
MKKRTGIMVALATGAGLLGLLAVAAAPGRGPKPLAATSSQAAPPAATDHAAAYASQAITMLDGVLVPLSSLRAMQRSLAASPSSTVRQVPTLALLNAPLKTTGLGAIRIGMSLDEVAAAGFTLAPVQGVGSGECQFYRIQDHSEPIGLMAVDDRILRIDVGPGSLTQTLSGAKIGSSEQDLVNLYGDQLEATANPVTLGKTIVFKPKDPGEDIYRLVFETDDRGRVVQYRAGQFPSVTWPEGCS